MHSKLAVFICLVAALTGGLLYSTLNGSRTHPELNQKLIQTFARWKQLHGKLYASPAENNFRLSVFADQTAFINKKNQDYEAYIEAQGQTLSGPMFEMNMFGDLTNEEFAARYTGSLSPNQEMIKETETEEPIPEFPQVSASQNHLGQLPSFQPKVRNQGSCGSCWAFAALVEMERVTYIKNAQFIDLAVQELVDCVPENSGCGGGFSEHAFNYVLRNGISKASEYPYIGSNTACRPRQSKAFFPEFKFIPNLGQFSITKARQAYLSGVMPSVSLNGNGSFRYLSRTTDIYDARNSGECATYNSHSIAMVAAYMEKDLVVVRILNSWGTGWGANGFKRIIPCNENSLLGIGATWASPYGY